MPKHKINWVNDHTPICDRLAARVQLMQDYLDRKPDDFDGIAAKQSLLGQAREQVTWYRQSIDALGRTRSDREWVIINGDFNKLINEEFTKIEIIVK